MLGFRSVRWVLSITCLRHDRGACLTISFFLTFLVDLDGIFHPQTGHSSNVIAAIPPPLCRCATTETLSTDSARLRRWPALQLRQLRRHRLKTLVWTSFLLIWRTTHDERSIINTIIITIWSSRSSSFFVLFHMLLQADVFISCLLLLMSHHLTSQSKLILRRFMLFLLFIILLDCHTNDDAIKIQNAQNANNTKRKQPTIDQNPPQESSS